MISSIYLPQTLEVDINFIRQALPLTDKKRIQTNISYLSQARPFVTALSQERIDLLCKINALFSDMLDSFPQSKDITHTLKEQLYGFEHRFNTVPLNRYGLQKYIKKEYVHPKNNLLFLSDSHITTYASLKALPKHIRQQTALLILDHHVDIYFEYFDPKRYAAKHNFLTQLFQYKDIASVVTIGATQADEPELSKFHRRIRRMLKYPKIDPLVRISTEDLFPGSIKPEGLDRNKFQKETDNIIQLFRNTHVKYLYVSFDIDVLSQWETPYTSCDYNIIAPLIGLSFVDLSLLSKRRIEPFLKILMTYNPLTFNTYVLPEYSSITSLPKFVKGKSLSLDGSCMILDMLLSRILNSSITLGCPIGQQRIVGDITELSGLDFESHTASAVRKIIAIIEKNIVP